MDFEAFRRWFLLCGLVLVVQKPGTQQCTHMCCVNLRPRATALGGLVNASIFFELKLAAQLRTPDHSKHGTYKLCQICCA